MMRATMMRATMTRAGMTRVGMRRTMQVLNASLIFYEVTITSLNMRGSDG